jgi:hypothetical protein
MPGQEFYTALNWLSFPIAFVVAVVGENKYPGTFPTISTLFAGLLFSAAFDKISKTRKPSL